MFLLDLFGVDAHCLSSLDKLSQMETLDVNVLNDAVDLLASSLSKRNPSNIVTASSIFIQHLLRSLKSRKFLCTSKSSWYRTFCNLILSLHRRLRGGRSLCQGSFTPTNAQLYWLSILTQYYRAIQWHCPTSYAVSVNTFYVLFSYFFLLIICSQIFEMTFYELFGHCFWYADRLIVLFLASDRTLRTSQLKEDFQGPKSFQRNGFQWNHHFGKLPICSRERLSGILSVIQRIAEYAWI